jgi:hypothetical protein
MDHQPRTPSQLDQVGNLMLTGMESSLANQSLSQLSQVGENLVDTREQDNEINQIRISNRNFSNHQMLNQNNAHFNLRFGGESQRALNDQQFSHRYINAPHLRSSMQISQVQLQEENPNSSRMDEIGRERRSMMSEIAIPQISQIQRLHSRHVRPDAMQMQARQPGQLQQPGGVGRRHG